MPLDRREEYLKGLRTALDTGVSILAQGGTALDAVEAVVRTLEDDPLFNAGRGAVFTHDETVELDASIMDGRTLACGAVCGVKTVKNPISLARLVMEKTSHVLLSGAGAEQFAAVVGVERCENSYFYTEHRHRALQQAKATDQVQLDHSGLTTVDSKISPAQLAGTSAGGVSPTADSAGAGAGSDEAAHVKGTVGCVALDAQGNLAVATSTGGMTNKRWGRVGDSPIIGAGSYANNKSCAVSSTGAGEEFIRHVVAHDIAALMEYGGHSVAQAADLVVHTKLAKGDGGVIAVSKDGEVAMPYNSVGMFRAAADSNGLHTVKIWE